jgi:hypothetical protein
VKKSYKKKQRHLQYESLERREMMAVTAKLSKAGVLTVKGTSKVDIVNFVQTSGILTVSGAKKGSFDANLVNSIVIDLKKGNDTVSFNSLTNGGNQVIAEVITFKNTAIGTDVAKLANGNDVSLYGKNHTLYVNASGTAWLDGIQLSWNNPNPPTPPNPNPPTPPNPNPPNPPSGSWFDNNVVDTALRTLGNSLYADSVINRADMIALLKNVEDGGTIDATELNDLRTIVGNASLFGSNDDVLKLGTYIASGSVANAKYQGQNLGNLAAGSTTAHMEKLINKWFLGLDRPTANAMYRLTSGQLFVNGPSYSDVNQGYLGDCYFLASLAEVALKNPSAITSMFTVNGDGTYSVKFYNNGQAHYVTVDSYLPADASGHFIYANLGGTYTNSGNELWVALAEKAYAQINEMGWTRVGLSGSGQNSYLALESGYVYASMGHVTGVSITSNVSTAGGSSFTTFVNAYNQNKSIAFSSKASPGVAQVVANHAYAVIGYNTSNQTVTLYNPWGTQYTLTLSWSQIQSSFNHFDHTA